MSFKYYFLNIVRNHEHSRILAEYEKLNSRNQELTGTKDTHFLPSGIPLPNFDRTPTKLHPDLKPDLKELENIYKQFLLELDYLNNFLSVLLRTNVPKEVKEAIIPEPIRVEYERLNPFVYTSSSYTLVDINITEEYMNEKYAEEIYYLNKYLVYLMIGDWCA